MYASRRKPAGFLVPYSSESFKKLDVIVEYRLPELQDNKSLHCTRSVKPESGWAVRAQGLHDQLVQAHTAVLQQINGRLHIRGWGKDRRSEKQMVEGRATIERAAACANQSCEAGSFLSLGVRST